MMPMIDRSDLYVHPHYRCVAGVAVAPSADGDDDDDDTEYNMVDHPKHYNSHPSGVECIDIIEWMPYNLGAAMKYVWRAGLKPGADHAEDLRKAVWYINREIERLTKEEE